MIQLFEHCIYATHHIHQGGIKVELLRIDRIQQRNTFDTFQFLYGSKRLQFILLLLPKDEIPAKYCK